VSDTQQVEVRPTVGSIVKSLNQLGMHGVHALLVEKSVKGRRRTTMSCPIANYVRAETGIDVMVGGSWLKEVDHVERRYDFSDSVADFVSAFDGGQFGDLLDV